MPAFSLLCLSIWAVQARAENEQFNTDFLQDINDQISVEAVKNGYSLTPGMYKFAISINQKQQEQYTLRIYTNQQNEIAACLDQAFIDHFGILFESPEQKQLDAEGCYQLETLPQAIVKLDAGAQKLALNLAQVNLNKFPQGYVSPQLFNQGINAVVLNYTANSNYVRSQNGEHRQNSSLFLNGGFNVGAWRYRNQTSLVQSSNEKARWQTTSNKLERDIISRQARLELGDTYTNNDVFDSVNFRGLQLSRELTQLPVSQQNYAPVVRGTAFTNATVEIKQNGYLVYSTNVSPGEFKIDDLYAANQSGDLEVTIIESDGRVQKFVQPYSAVPNMIRPGQYKYQITAGQYRNGNQDSLHPYFGQMSFTYGLNNYLSPYTGAIVSKDYYAVSTGLAWMLGSFGSFSTDLTYAKNTLHNGEQKDGSSFRFLYSKSLNTLGTNLNLVGYRYSTAGYYSFSDAVQEKSQWRDGAYEYRYEDVNQADQPMLSENQRYQTYTSSTFYNKKNQAQISINQDLGKWGQFYGSLIKTDYWQKNYDVESWQIGYNNSHNRVNYGAYFQQDKSLFTGSNYTAGITLSFKLDQPKAFKNHDVTLNNAYRYSEISGSSVQSALSGSFLEDKNLNLQLQVAHADQNQSSVGLSSNYRGSKLNSNFGYSYDQNYQQVSAGISGGILIHRHGFMFGQQMNSNPILIEAKGAEGVRVENQPGLKIDRHGYAIVSGSSAYMKNRVALKAEDLGQNISVDQAVFNDVVPTKMAIVKVKFDVKSGANVLASLSYRGKAVMTGTAIFNQENANIGIVGLNGQAYLTAVESGQSLTAKWGEDEYQQCHFNLPQLTVREFGYDEISIECVGMAQPADASLTIQNIPEEQSQTQPETQSLPLKNALELKDPTSDHSPRLEITR